MDATDWSHIENPWQLSNWKGNPYTMVWGIPMLPCGSSSTQCQTNVSDYDLVASGGANGYYKTLAKNLVASGFGTSYIRLGWEFNGSEMGWAVCNADGSGLASWAGDFVPAFRNIVTSMRSVSGANFKFVWNPLVSSNVGCPGNNFEKFYPGDKLRRRGGTRRVRRARPVDHRLRPLERPAERGQRGSVDPGEADPHQRADVLRLRAELDRRLLQGARQADLDTRVGTRLHQPEQRGRGRRVLREPHGQLDQGERRRAVDLLELRRRQPAAEHPELHERRTPAATAAFKTAFSTGA